MKYADFVSRILIVVFFSGYTEVFMNKNRFYKSLFSLAALFCVLLFSTCEVGLGSSVDINNPSLTIDYPAMNSVIRENFTVSGTCKDDTGVKNVSIVV